MSKMPQKLSRTAKGLILAVATPIILHGIVLITISLSMKTGKFDSVAFAASTLRMTLTLLPILSVILLPVHLYCRRYGLTNFRLYAAGIFLLTNVIFLFVKPEITPGFGTMAFNENLLCAPLITEAKREAIGDTEVFKKLEKDITRSNPSPGLGYYKEVEAPWLMKVFMYDVLIGGFITSLLIMYIVSFTAGFIFWKYTVRPSVSLRV